MAYNAIVTRLKNVRPHGNADKVKLASCHGNQVVIDLNEVEDALGVFFPSDGQLSHEFCYANNLYREAEQNINPKAKPGMFDLNRRVRTQKFRGEVSDGFWVDLSYFKFLKIDKASLVEGYEFDTLKGIPICSKYINPATAKIARENQKKTKTSKRSIMFKEHFDTGQLGPNMHQFNEDDVVILSRKLHGTSGRVGYVQMERSLSFIEKVAKLVGVKVNEYEWTHLSGSRRTVQGESKGIPFHEPTIREKAMKMFEGNLRKGETVYFEIVGFENTGAPIMQSVGTAKLNDKEFTKQYGDVMTFKYGCAPGESDVYLYRMTLTNNDGQSVDYSWDDMVKRASEIGVKTVPFVLKTSMKELHLLNVLDNIAGVGLDYNEGKAKERLVKIIQSHLDTPSVLDPEHIEEGIVVRIEGGLTNKSYKMKGYNFKVLEGIIKDSGVVDVEEAEDLQKEG